MPNIIKNDLIGYRSGMLLSIERQPRFVGKDLWYCKCDCGVYLNVNRTLLIRPQNKISCGCYKRPPLRSRPIKHGMSHSRVYSIWAGMKDRCNNPRNRLYKRYGERGIQICDRWNIFENFFEDMGNPPEKLSIDRIDVNGNYEKSNCRWATCKEQSRNTRVNNLITYQGETQCVTTWAERFGINTSTLFHRLKLGWKFENAVKPGRNYSKTRGERDFTSLPNPSD